MKTATPDVAQPTSRPEKQRLIVIEELPADAESRLEADPLAAFPSETDTAASPPRPTVAPRMIAARPRPARSLIALAVLGLVAVAQAVILSWLQARPGEWLPDTGSATISSEPPGATVMVDNQPRGVTPLQLALAPGDHQVTVGEGAALHTRAITVARGSDATLHVELQNTSMPASVAAPTTGTLQIDTEPRRGQVSVDGRPRGVAPVSVADLAPGPHTITVSSAAGSLSQTAIVRQGAVSSVVIALKAQHASGWLAVTSDVPLQIYSGRTLVGTTDTPRVMLSAGRHDVRLVNAALNFRVTKTVQVEPGKTNALAVQLPSANVHVNALPWAEVSLGSRVLGETPLANVALPIGSHELIFRHPELGEQRKMVTVRAGEAVRVGVDLRKARP